MNFLQIFRRSSRLTLINGVGVAVNFLTGTYVANLFGPETFGAISLVMLWVSYAGLARPGLFEGGQRELISALGREDRTAAVRFQNTGFWGELIWSLLPALVLLTQTMWAPDALRRHAFLLAPLLYLGQGVTRMLSGLILAHQKMGLYTTAYVVRALLQPPLLVFLARTAGPLALLLAPALVEGGLAIFYSSKCRQLGIRPALDLPAARYLVTVGFPLALSAIAYWAYRLAGPTSIAAFLPAAALGAYVFSSKIIDQVTRFFGDFANILMPSLWSNLARAESPRDLLPDIGRITVWMVMLACFACNVIQAVAGQAVAWFVPRFIPSVSILELLAFNTILLAMPMPASIILDSSGVNKQKAHLGIWIVGCGVNYLANFVCLQKGYSVTVIACNDLWVQVGVCAAIYMMVSPYLFGNARTAWRFQVPLLIMTACCGLVYIILGTATLKAGGSTPMEAGVRLLERTLFVLATWTAAWLVVLRLSQAKSAGAVR